MNKENLVVYCPLCGHRSKKDFSEEDELGLGGEWCCEQCNRYVEAYYLMEDEEYDALVNEKLEIEKDIEARTERGIGLGLPLLLIVIIVILTAYILF